MFYFFVKGDTKIALLEEAYCSAQVH